MTGPMPAPAPIGNAWQAYNEREAECRTRYLFVVESAHRQYLAGPWPDRDGYDAVERSAWMTYYHSCRDAWQEFVQRVNAAPPAAPSAAPSFTAHPSPGYPDQFDQRQEMYLAADPNRRDGY